MSSDDPFFSPKADDKTFIRPVPGGKRSEIRQPSSSTVSSSNKSQSLPTLGRLNPLERASSGLLALLTGINSSYNQSDPIELKNKIILEIQQFQNTAQIEGVDSQTISSARYVMCTVLDEAVLNTPWGNNSGWAQQSLLSLFHKEVSGGERFFHLLKSLSENPSKNRNILELMYLCMALGFEGRYRIIEGGKNKLIGIREWLFQILQKERGKAELALSPHWQGVTDRRNPLARFVPLWVFAAVAAGLLAAVFSFFLIQLNKESDPIFRQIFSIKAPVQETVLTAVSEPIYTPDPIFTPVTNITLSILLADEIKLNRIDVTESVQRSIIILQGDNLFSSGSVIVNRSIIPLLYKITDALNQLPGQILITGHSDNVPIRSSRYPSNWHLSKARAEAVNNVIKQKLKDPARTIIEGRSDLDPIASNATREGRAKNRRVEITLLN